jgi:hypothetical protein
MQRTLLTWRGALAGLGLALLLVGCQHTEPLTPPLEMADVIVLHERGCSARTIGAEARGRGLDFPMTGQNVLELRRQGIPESTVQVLLEAERHRARLAAAERGLDEPPPRPGPDAAEARWYPYRRDYAHW